MNKVRLLNLLVVAGCVVLAQSPQGALTGNITDPQGSGIPGVAIEAKQVSTGLVFRGVSTADGTYIVPALPSGPYEVKASANGFKTIRRTDVIVEVAARQRLDLQFQIGSLNETVTVSGETPRIQTEDSSLGTVVERQRIENLPLNGRHVFNLVKLVPGVQPRFRDADGFAEITNQNFSQIRFNGGPIFGNQFFLDGAANTLPVHNEISVVPMVDAVEEFRVETNALKAEFGQTSGGFTNVVTKSGSNEFHGSAYEFFRNEAIDARNAFSTQLVNGRLKPVLRFNQYGGTLGGPVSLPKIYNGKNRTFFFAGYEQWRWRNADIRRATVPTAAQRGGDFSQTLNSLGALVPIYDPATTRANPNGAGFVRDRFAGNIIPRSRFDSVSLKVLEFMPQGNVAPADPITNSLNFTSLAATPVDNGVTTIRADHRISDSDSVFFRYSGTRNSRFGRGFGLGVADPDAFARNDQRDNHSATAAHTHTFSPRLLNDLRVAAVRQNLPFEHPSADGGWPAKLGLPSTVPQDLFPPFSPEGFLALGASATSKGVRAQQYVQVLDSVTWISGKHQFKAGVDHRWMRLNFFNLAQPSGAYSFSSALTGDPLAPAGTGNGIATMLLGAVSGGNIGVVPHFSFHSWTNSTYVQDDFKLTPRLTFNLGLRYDLSSAPRERHNRHSNFDPFVRNPDTGTLGALTYAGSTAPSNFVDRSYGNLGPRFGFAYQATADGKTVVRGGYGLIYIWTESGDTVGDNSNAAGFSLSTPFAANGPFPVFQLKDGPPTILQPRGPTGGPSGVRGLGATYQDRNAPTPYLQQYNLTIQRALAGGWTVTASYAGNRGVKLFGGNYNLNQLDPQYFSLGLTLQDQVPNPYFGQISTGPISGRTITRAQSLLPYPDYQAINTLANHGSSSTYHSLQLVAEKRFASGVSALLSYTKGKLINDSFSSGGGASLGNDFRIGRLNRRLDRAIDQDDVSQRFVGSGVVELPFGPGKRWLGQSRGLAGNLAGGWQLNTITTLQTGVPLIIRGANNFTGIAWPNVLRDPTLPSSQRSAQGWFDTSAIANPPNFVMGNIPRTLPRTRGPGLVDVSLSAYKTLQFGEKRKLEFRVETFNSLNHVNLGDPNLAFSPNPQGVNVNANFGKIFSSLPARRIQLGLRFAF
jgi:hypothetical protein